MRREVFSYDSSSAEPTVHSVAMRRVAMAPAHSGEVKRVMLFDSGRDGVYLFLYRAVKDQAAFADELYESVEEAEGSCLERFGVAADQWQDIPDPQPGCQHDWIAPVRVVGRDTGTPQWGKLERLEDGKWVRVSDSRS